MPQYCALAGGPCPSKSFESSQDVHNAMLCRVPRRTLRRGRRRCHVLVVALRRSCSLHHTTQVSRAQQAPNTPTSLRQVSCNTYLLSWRRICWMAAMEREIFAIQGQAQGTNTSSLTGRRGRARNRRSLWCDRRNSAAEECKLTILLVSALPSLVQESGGRRIRARDLTVMPPLRSSNGLARPRAKHQPPPLQRPRLKEHRCLY